MDQIELAQKLERARPRLRAIAYRIVGSLSEADDAVQEAWLRLQRTPRDEIDNLDAWLTTVVVRICLNILRSRRSRAEEPLGAFVPEPIISTDPSDDPEHQALLA
ncbi:MAG: RNA polymerase subunit sigma-70, partial [Solirubrobacterales bacterium]|nr:RNA polymerase subunit sigma-70 [Solirubrobacterales bacterium]